MLFWLLFFVAYCSQQFILIYPMIEANSGLNMRSIERELVLFSTFPKFVTLEGFEKP